MGGTPSGKRLVQAQILFPGKAEEAGAGIGATLPWV